MLYVIPQYCYNFYINSVGQDANKIRTSLLKFMSSIKHRKFFRLYLLTSIQHSTPKWLRIAPVYTVIFGQRKADAYVIQPRSKNVKRIKKQFILKINLILQYNKIIFILGNYVCCVFLLWIINNIIIIKYIIIPLQVTAVQKLVWVDCVVFVYCRPWFKHVSSALNWPKNNGITLIKNYVHSCISHDKQGWSKRISTKLWDSFETIFCILKTELYRVS